MLVTYRVQMNYQGRMHQVFGKVKANNALDAIEKCELLNEKVSRPHSVEWIARMVNNAKKSNS